MFYMFGLGYAELSIILLIPVAIIIAVIFILKSLLKSKPSGKSQSGRLRELEQMKAEGLISDDEFNKKRKEVLRSI